MLTGKPRDLERGQHDLEVLVAVVKIEADVVTAPMPCAQECASALASSCEVRGRHAP